MNNVYIEKYLKDDTVPYQKRDAMLKKLESGEISEDQMVKVVNAGYQRRGDLLAVPGAKAYTADPSRFAPKEGSMSAALQEEKDIGVGFIERPLRVAKRAIEGVGEVGSGLVRAGYYSSGAGMVNPWEDMSAQDQSQAGLRGLSDAIQGAGTVAASPLAASPTAEAAMGKVGQVIQGGVGDGITKLGIDPNSQQGQDIQSAIMSSIDLGMAIAPAVSAKVKTKGVKSGLSELASEGTQFLKDTPGIIESIPRALDAALEKGVNLSESTKARNISRTVNDLGNIQQNRVNVKKIIENAESKGINVKQKLAETDLLHKTVDKDGTIRAKEAIDKLHSELDPFEGVLREALEKEGKTVGFDVIEASLREAVLESSLRGANKQSAMSKINKELSGLKLDAVDEFGNPWKGEGTPYLPASVLQEAKIDLATNSNWMNPKANVVDKAFSRKFRDLIEKTTESVDARKINRELSEWYSVRSLLKELDGAKVKKGRLGKYFGGTIGAIVGSNLGPLGALAGAEVGSALTGLSMSRTFGPKVGGAIEIGPTLKATRAELSKPASAVVQKTKAELKPKKTKLKLEDKKAEIKNKS